MSGLALSARQRYLRGAAAAAVVASGVTLGSSAVVRADGAFPNSESILLPRDRPKTIILATTFGLVSSEDDGATWLYSCEVPETRMDMRFGRPYVMGPPPDNRIFALSNLGAPVSADFACTWTIAGGDVTATRPIDVFPDPTNVLRAFALATPIEGGLASAYRSLNGGLTYSGPIFTPPPTATVTGIESASSAPQTVYVTMYEGAGVHPRLVESRDGGDTWTTMDIEPGLGPVVPYLAAVDPKNSRRLFLRVTSGGGNPAPFEGLAITADGGLTWRTPLEVPGGGLSGLIVLANGDLLAIGVTARPSSTEQPVPALFRSVDGGQTFATEALAFHAVGLAERNGIVFAATNYFLDGFALVSSEDGGRTWRPRLRFDQIAGMKECVRAICQGDCDDWAGLKLFPPATCNPAPLPEPPSKEQAARGKGCGCDLGGGGAALGLGAVGLLFGWLLRARRHRGRS